MDDSGNNTKNPFALMSNPLDLDVILDRVLDYVGGNKKSLLNCRLVNQRWNSLVLLKLRKQANSFISLDPSNILEYVKLNKKSKQTSPCLPISVTLQEYIDDSQENYDVLVAGVRKLVRRFGPTCIEKIQISGGEQPMYHDDWSQLLKRINTCSAGLQHLLIKPGPSNESLDSLLSARRKLISFPSLTTLSYWGIPKSPELLVQLVNAAPNLQNLYLDLSPREMSYNAYINIMAEDEGELINQQITNAITSCSASTLSQLTELKIVLTDDSSYEALSAYEFPSLKSLKISFTKKISLISGNILNSFLTNNCTVLSSLHFCFLYCKFELYDVLLTHDGVRGEFPAGFPTLPNITHFEASYAEEPKSLDSGSPSAFIQIDHLKSTNFPNLSSVTIMYGTHFYYSPAFAGYDQYGLDEEEQLDFQWVNNPRVLNHVCFEKVGSLTLVVDHRIRSSQFGRFVDLLPAIWMDGAVNQLHLLFPNVKALCIDNQIRPDEDSLVQLKDLIIKCLVEIADLESLTITNYVQDVFNEFQLPGINEQQLESLKSLTLPPIQKYYKQIMESRGKSIGYASPITHVEVTINGLPLFASLQTSPDDSLVIDNSNFGHLIMDNISLQLRNLTTNNDINADNAIVNIEPIYSTTSAAYYEDLALICKCLEPIIYVEKSSVVGLLASHLLAQLQYVNAFTNKSRIYHGVASSLNISKLLTIAPGLEELRIGEEFFNNDVGDMIEEYKASYPELKIVVLS